MPRYAVEVDATKAKAMRAAADLESRSHISEWVLSLINKELEKKGLWKPQPHLAHLDEPPAQTSVKAAQPAKSEKKLSVVDRAAREKAERLKAQQIAKMDAELEEMRAAREAKRRKQLEAQDDEED